jgi:PRTRC genetic system protein B
MLESRVADSEKAASLKGAILLYGGDRNNGVAAAFATVHDVETIAGRPEIMPGRLMMERDLVTIAENLAAAKDAIATRWIDSSLLATGGDRMIWWTPPSKRPMFFQTSPHVKGSFDGHAVCPVPGLVWVAMYGEGLYVYAVKGAARPTPDTSLFQAPLFNIWGRGKVCVGSAHLPKDGERQDPTAWEKVIFGSYFTHPNFSEPDRLVKGIKPTTFWKNLVAAPPNAFPEKRLVPMDLKVEHLLERTLLDRLGRIRKPKGEF